LANLLERSPYFSYKKFETQKTPGLSNQPACTPPPKIENKNRSFYLDLDWKKQKKEKKRKGFWLSLSDAL